MRPAALLFSCLVTLGGLASVGCAPALHIKKLDSAEEKPANVLLFFRVTANDAPVAALQESAFTVKEDERVIGPGVDRVIVNPDLRPAQATLVLVDLGGRPSANELEAMSGALGAVVDRLGSGRRTAIFALDGAEQPAILAPFGSPVEALKGAAAKIPSFKPRDPSLDLNGGYIAALRALRQATPPSSGPRIANLVLIARGTDRASRVDLKAVAAELQHAEVDIARYAVAYGSEAAKIKLDSFADGSFFVATGPEALKDATSRIAEAIDARGRSFYLLSYCTAARGGQHKVTLDVMRERESRKGHVEVDHGSLDYTFRADGFGPGCTPNVPEGWKPDTAVHTVQVERGGAKPSLAGVVSRPR